MPESTLIANRFLQEALRQSARDVGCKPEDLLRRENTFTLSSRRKGAKAFYPEKADFLAVNYGFGNAVSVREDKFEAVSGALKDTDIIFAGDLISLGFIPTFENICFLPAGDDIAPLPCRYDIRLLLPDEFKNLYLPEWSNALCSKRPQLDKIAVGAYDGDKLIGLAGASQDAENMLQIGIDVLPEYRKNGIASVLTSVLAQKIIKAGQTPFYSCLWNNTPSFKNALRAGFKPVWTEIQAKTAE